jgi:four helix bundle protein
MTNAKKFDLADRTASFAIDCRHLIRSIPKDLCNIEDCKQLARSSGSVAANYLEADEALSKKDFAMRIKICRKEARESKLWLTAIAVKEEFDMERNRLKNEAYELVKIFNAIVSKSS